MSLSKPVSRGPLWSDGTVKYHDSIDEVVIHEVNRWSDCIASMGGGRSALKFFDHRRNLRNGQIGVRIIKAGKGSTGTQGLGATDPNYQSGGGVSIGATSVQNSSHTSEGRPTYGDFIKGLSRVYGASDVVPNPNIADDIRYDHHTFPASLQEPQVTTRVIMMLIELSNLRILTEVMPIRPWVDGKGIVIRTVRFDSHIAERQAFEAPSAYVTFRESQAKASQVRFGIAQRIEGTLLSTPTGQDLWWRQTIQMRNAALVCQVLGANTEIVSCRRTATTNAGHRRRQYSPSEFEDVMTAEIELFNVISKRMDGIDVISDKAHAILTARQEPTSNVIFITHPGVPQAVVARPEQRLYYLSGTARKTYDEYISVIPKKCVSAYYQDSLPIEDQQMIDFYQRPSTIGYYQSFRYSRVGSAHSKHYRTSHCSFRSALDSSNSEHENRLEDMFRHCGAYTHDAGDDKLRHLTNIGKAYFLNYAAAAKNDNLREVVDGDADKDGHPVPVIAQAYLAMEKSTHEHEKKAARELIHTVGSFFSITHTRHNMYNAMVSRIVELTDATVRTAFVALARACDARMGGDMKAEISADGIWGATVDDKHTVIKQILQSWHVKDSRFWEFCMEHNIPIFLDFDIASPHVVWQMYMGVFLRLGCGYTYWMKPDYSISQDGRTKMVEGNLTFHSRTFISTPEQVVHVQDIQARKYIGGGGPEYYRHTKEDREKYKAGTDQKASRFAILRRPGAPANPDRYSLSGAHPTQMVSSRSTVNPDTGIATPVVAYETALPYAEDWGWENLPHRDRQKYREFTDPEVKRANLTVCQDYQLLRDSGTSETSHEPPYALYITPKNHWGHHCGPGVRRFRLGASDHDWKPPWERPGARTLC